MRATPSISPSMLSILILALVAALTEGACPSSWGSPRKDIVCYYSGKRAASTLDACLCTHLVYNSIGLNDEGSINISKDVQADLEAFRTQNPSLKVIASLGGDSFSSETFSSLITERERLDNLTSSINSFYTDGIINGIEIDWEWPVQEGGKKDRVKLIRYARQIKIAVGEEVVVRKPRVRDLRKRDVIDEEETTTFVTMLLRAESEETTDEPDSESTTLASDVITTQSSHSTSVSFSFSSSSSSSSNKDDHKGERVNDDSESSASTTTTNTNRKQSRTRQTTTSTHSLHSSGTVSKPRVAERRTRKFEKANPLKARKPIAPSSFLDEDYLLDEEDDLTLDEAGKKNEGFLIFLRLSPIPEYLVQGYEFKLLNKFVDFYILSSQNFTGNANATYHHSRLMGVSDVENADSLLDIVTSLGADEGKIILTATAFGNKFTLLDVERNVPGAASIGRPETITYQQVCQSLKKGNWTVERDEDLTGPYGFGESKLWMAFDDSMSLRIKTKYALLRNLGGVALDSIEADDVDNVCGNGEQSLLKSIRKTLTQLERKTRQLIVHSLEEDLVASAQTLAPVIAGVNVSPYRIVRIVDREGQITGVRQNSETTLECTRQGYYRNPEDCSLFYRCVKFNQYENDYTIFEYGCPAGLVFDERWEVCVWPSQAAPCDGSSEIRPVPRNPYVCSAEGYFVDPENCRWFYACFDHKGDGTFTHYEFRCPFGLGFDEANLICNWPWLVPGCGGTAAVGGAIGAGGAERGGKFLRPDVNRGINRQPAAPRQEKTFGRGNNGERPAFADNNNNLGPAGAGTQTGADPFRNSFKSPNPARQPTLAARPVVRPTTPAFATTAQSFDDGNVFGDIAVENCENCESQGIQVFGDGDINGQGIEVVRGGGIPSSTFSPSTTAGGDGGYSYPVPANPLDLPDRRPAAPGIAVSNPGEIGLIPDGGLSTTFAPSTAAPSSAAPSTTAGYVYPVPANPLQYPDEYDEQSAQPLIPSTTARPVYPSTTFQSTTPSPTYPSTTRAPVYPSSTPDSGYAYPVPANPLEFPDYSEEQVAPQAIYQSSPQPIYQSSPQPIYQSSPQPTYPSTTRAPVFVSTTPEAVYQPVAQEEPVYFSTPRVPAPTYASTTRAPVYPSSTATPAYQQPENDGGYVYAVPANPLVLPERPSQPQYNEAQRGSDFNPPPLEFGGFKPPFEAEPERPRNYQQPSFVADVQPAEIQYGFKPSPEQPRYTTLQPQQPRKPFADSSFNEPADPAFVPAFTTPRPVPAPVAAPPQAQREVASVIPSGFTSATLSNGPNSIDQGRFNSGSGNGNGFGPRPTSFGNTGSGAPAAGFGGSAPRAPKAGFGNGSPEVPSAGLENDLSSGNNGAFGPGGARPVGAGFGGSGAFGGAGSGIGGGAFGNGNGGNNGGSGNGAFNNGNRGFNAGNTGLGGQNGNGGNRGNGNGAFNSGSGNPGIGGGNGNGGNRGNGNGAFNGGNGNPGIGGGNGNGGNRGNGNGAFNGGNGNPGIGGGNPGLNGGNGNPGFNGGNGNGGFNGGNGNGGFNGGNGNGGNNGGSGPAGNGGNAGRGGREFSRFEGTVPDQGINSITAVTRPVQKQPAVLNKFKGTDWNKFGPGGFRAFNDTIGPEVCERPGLFRHPTDCDKFYECYYDKWIDKFTVHVFPCPIVLGYDTGITACNWPFEGPQCQAVGK